MKLLTATVLATALAISSVAVQARDILVRFNGGIGVIPASNGAGPANADGTLPNVKLNVVRGVPPGGGPWTIKDLKAEVDISGRITVRGRGLLLASGNSIGQNGNQKVFATLFCEGTTPFLERSTDPLGVPLEVNGDFRIDDQLNPAPVECPNPVLLIRNTGGVWFAAGIPQFGDD